MNDGHFAGPIIPFGATIECHPATAKDKARLHQLGKNVLPSFFGGCTPFAGES